MRRVTSIHPDLLAAVPNPPEALLSDFPSDASPALTGEDLPEGRMLASRRHQRGRSHLAAVINHWLGRSGLSHDQLGAIADWALSERGWLISSQLSHLRNARIARGASLRNLDALAGANVAIWRWQTQGEAEARKALGPQSTYGIDEAWLNDACWLPHPEDAGEPLAFPHWCEVCAGHLRLPYVGPINLSPSEAQDLSQKLAELIDREVSSSGLGLRAGLAAFLAAFPLPGDKARLAKLRAVVIGEADYSQTELEAEMFALAETIRVWRQLPEGSYGPGELHAELSADRRRL